MTFRKKWPINLAPRARIQRAALEALALEGYRSDRLSEADIRELLGFETRMEVHGFLKKHGAFLHYSDLDLEHDREIASRVALRPERNDAEVTS